MTEQLQKSKKINQLKFRKEKEQTVEIPKHQSHLDVAVIVAGVATVARVNQDGVEAVHDGVA